MLGPVASSAGQNEIPAVVSASATDGEDMI